MRQATAEPPRLRALAVARALPELPELLALPLPEAPALLERPELPVRVALPEVPLARAPMRVMKATLMQAM